MNQNHPSQRRPPAVAGAGRRLYLAGQRYFGNRGCEALVRSTVKMLREELGAGTAFLTPSLDAALDRRQWPQAEPAGVRFVRSVPFPSKLRWWYRAVRALPAAKRVWLPRSMPVPREIHDDVAGSDAMILIGGDNFSLDYTTAGLLGQTAFSEVFLRRGTPMVLWAASVGPFAAEPVFERYMAGFLNRLDLITVRETVSQDYLHGIGVRDQVHLVADPAFLLEPEALPLDTLVPAEAGAGLLGLNLSPLVDQARYGRRPQDAQATVGEVLRFIESAVRDHDLSVVLVPHVDPLTGGPGNSDSAYLGPILAGVGHLGPRVSLAPSHLNAAQLKHLIGTCRFFIGARTHATIASLSSGVPTLSIAYSIKARGLNRDLFGHERYVLPTPQLSAASLTAGLETLLADEASIRELLGRRIPEWQQRARQSACLLARHLNTAWSPS